MGKSAKKRKSFRTWFLREWRKDRGLTLEALASRIGSTGATVSRLERGQQPYSQPLLEALADALNCQPADLIMRPPGAADRLKAVLDSMSEADQTRALAVIQALKDSKAA